MSIFIVVDTGRRFSVNIDGTVYTSPTLVSKHGDTTSGYYGGDHYSKDSESYTVTTKQFSITLSHCDWTA